MRISDWSSDVCSSDLFPSKADLIATYLRYKSDAWFQMLATATERAGLSPLERVLAIFDALEEPLRAPSFRGCPFVKGLAEFGPEATSDRKSTRLNSSH